MKGCRVPGRVTAGPEMYCAQQQQQQQQAAWVKDRSGEHTRRRRRLTLKTLSPSSVIATLARKGSGRAPSTPLKMRQGCTRGSGSTGGGFRSALRRLA